MNFSNSANSNNSARRDVQEMEVDDPRSGTDSVPVPTGAKERNEQGEGEMAPPGPACSKVGYKARSRSGSMSSISSLMSNISAANAAARLAQQEQAQEANQLAMATDCEQDRDQIIDLDSGSDETEEDKSTSVTGDSSRKRKLTTEEGLVDLSDGSQRKQGRPRTTGLYVGRAKAQEEWNQKKKEAMALQHESAMRGMSSGQIFSKMETDLDEAMSEMCDTPTADIAHQARECMAEVFKVAKSSRNLKGGYVKILKHAAVMGSASTEVLRTRADNASGLAKNRSNSDALKQLKALREELEQVKREAQMAREEAERAKGEAATLRKELAETRGGRETRGRGRAFIEDSSPSPLPSPARGRTDKEAVQVKPAAAPAARAGESPMDMEIAAEGESQSPE